MCTHVAPESGLDKPLHQRPVAPLLVGALAVCGCAFINAADPTTPGGVMPLCPTKALFGFNCPGCGASRMVYSLLHFDFPAAFRYNAVGVIGLFLVLWSFVAWTASTFGVRIPRWEHWRYASATVGVVVLLWFIARVLPFEPFLSLRV